LRFSGGLSGGVGEKVKERWLLLALFFDRAEPLTAAGRAPTAGKMTAAASGAVQAGRRREK
jgi:hypothetical protein